MTLRDQRLALGLSQSEFAARLGVAVNTVSRWERGTLAVPPYASAYAATTLALTRLHRAIDDVRNAMPAPTIAAIPIAERIALDQAISEAKERL